MIKMSLEVPIKYLQKTERRVDFHFCIASTAIRHPEYLRFYRRKARECHIGKSDRFVMLDNGAYEEFAGGPPMVAIDTLVELVKKIKPQVVWAPDKMFDKDKTIRLTNDFQVAMDKVKGVAIGVIPQGRTAEEICECWYRTGQLSEWVGLSFKNDRRAILAQMPKSFFNCYLHMLGLNNMMEIAWWPQSVYSMDTSKPFKAAAHNMRLRALAPASKTLMRPTDTVDDVRLLYNNIEDLRAICHGEIRQLSFNVKG